MGFDVSKSIQSMTSYNTIRNEATEATDPRPYVSKLTASIQQLQASILSDADNAIKARQEAGKMPDATFINQVKEIETTVRNLFPKERDMPKELNAGLNQLIGISRNDCAANREEAIKQLKDSPVGSYAIWPSKSHPGQFALLQKLPGEDLTKKDAILLKGENLAERIQANLVNYCDSKEAAMHRYQTLDLGTCVVWPSANNPGKYGIIVKTKLTLTAEGLNAETRYLVDQKNITKTVANLQTDYQKQQEEKIKQQKTYDKETEEYYLKKDKTIPLWMIEDEEGTKGKEGEENK